MLHLGGSYTHTSIHWMTLLNRRTFENLRCPIQWRVIMIFRCQLFILISVASSSDRCCPERWKLGMKTMGSGGVEVVELKLVQAGLSFSSIFWEAPDLGAHLSDTQVKLLHHRGVLEPSLAQDGVECVVVKLYTKSRSGAAWEVNQEGNKASRNI